MERAEFETILSAAIESEIAAYTFYQEAAKRVADSYLKKMFTEFAQEEKHHRDILESLKANNSAAVQFETMPDYKISEAIETPAITTDMKPADAIAIAMKNEETAMKHYTRLAESCTDPEKEKLFLKLAAMERQHKHRMERAFVEVGFPEVW